MNCGFIKEVPTLKVVVAYVCVTQGVNTRSLVERFVRTWKENPPGYPCELVVLCNGGIVSSDLQSLFGEIVGKFLARPNDAGFDISAYQNLPQYYPDEFLVCLGESVHFHRSGWLERLVESRLEYGRGIYGLFSSHLVRAHLNTSGFAVDSDILRDCYPKIVRNHAERYEFEHGPGCFWKRVAAAGHGAWLVTWDGVWRPGEWRVPQNILNRGDQSNCLVWCNHTQRFADAPPHIRGSYAANSDRPFSA